MWLTQLVCQLGDATVCVGLQLLEIASIEIVSSALRSTVVSILLEVLESDPREPVITMLVLRIARLLLRHNILDLTGLAFATCAFLACVFLFRRHLALRLCLFVSVLIITVIVEVVGFVVDD